MAVVIDHGVTKNPIKPGDHLLILHPSPALQSARKRRLQDIFGCRSGLDAPFQKRQKLPMSFNQLRNRFRRKRLEGSFQCSPTKPITFGEWTVKSLPTHLSPLYVNRPHCLPKIPVRPSG